MIDDQIKTFMASDQFRRRAAELEPEIPADIALGKPVNLAAVPDELALGVVERWLADFVMRNQRNGETLVTLKMWGHNEPRPPLRQCRQCALSRTRSRYPQRCGAGRRQRQGRLSCGVVADRHGGEGGRHLGRDVQVAA
jgi:hypothetical protein